MLSRATHFMSLRAKIRGPHGILCTRGEKGANNHKSEHCRLRQCDFKSAVCAVRKVHRVKAMMRCFCLSAKAMLPSARCVPLTRFGFIFVIPSGNTRDPKRYFCTFGEKAHTSKRVSVIACDNAISKVQCATHLPEGLHIIKPTQDTFVLAWSNDGAKKHARKRVFESLFVLPCYFPTNPLMASSISL